MTRRSGFTLIEVMIYSVIFSLTAGIFFGVFNSVSTIQNREIVGVEVSRQLDFVLKNVERLVRDSSAIEMNSDEVSSTLKLRTLLSANDPTFVYASGTAIYLREGAQVPVSLTSDKVKLKTLEFEKKISEAGHDAVRVNLVLAYNSDNPKLQVTRNAQLVIPRISTVAIGSDIVPSINNTYSIGSSSASWRDLNVSQNVLVGSRFIMGTSTFMDPQDLFLAVASSAPALRVASSGRIYFGGLLDVAQLPTEPMGSNGALYYNTGMNKLRAFQGGIWTNLLQSVTGTDRWEFEHNDTSNSDDIFADRSLNVTIPNTNPQGNQLVVGGNIYSTGAQGGFKFVDATTLLSGRNSILSTNSNDTTLLNGGYSLVSGILRRASYGSDWFNITPTPSWAQRRGQATLNFAGKLWMMGGIAGPTYKNDVWSSSDGVTWTQVTAAAGWAPRYQHNALVFATSGGPSYMWILGGLGTATYNDVWYSADGAIWTRSAVTNGWPLKLGHAGLAYNGQLWVLGGTVGGNDVWYSANGTVWSKYVAQWAPRQYHAATVFDDGTGAKMWILGGDNNQVSLYGDVWYSTNGSVWTRSVLSSGWLKSSHAAFAYDNKLWVLGGWKDYLTNTVTSMSNDVWYSSNGSTWTLSLVNASWGARVAHSGSIFNNKIWIMGGTNNAVSYNDVWYSFSYPTTTYYWYQK